MKVETYTEDAKLMMAPMIDMVFLLIIFFMTASHLSSSQALRMELATASRGVIPKERPNRWVVNIEPNGNVYSGNQLVTIDELKQLVAARIKENPNLKVEIRADANSQHKQAKKVMNTLAAAGVEEFIFAVYNPEAGETTP
jgi:biopolymer transport protein ExbD